MLKYWGQDCHGSTPALHKPLPHMRDAGARPFRAGNTLVLQVLQIWNRLSSQLDACVCKSLGAPNT